MARKTQRRPDKMKKPKKEAVIQLYKAGTAVQQIMEITGIKAKRLLKS